MDGVDYLLYIYDDENKNVEWRERREGKHYKYIYYHHNKPNNQNKHLRVVSYFCNEKWSEHFN